MLSNYDFRIKMDVKSLEHPTLKVPYEILNKKFRTSQKIIDRLVLHINAFNFLGMLINFQILPCLKNYFFKIQYKG